jgi:hypothetical protein
MVAAFADLQHCTEAVGHGVTDLEALAASDAAARLIASATDQRKT